MLALRHGGGRNGIPHSEAIGVVDGAFPIGRAVVCYAPGGTLLTGVCVCGLWAECVAKCGQGVNCASDVND
jgi:hypothetical protein